MIPSNYHTHTRFCDGINTPEEIVSQALALGCPELGFSGHSYTFFDENYCMSKDGTQEYIETVRGLQEQYGDRIHIHLGIEQDYYSDMPTQGYDYVIGAVHYVKKDGCYLPVDESKQIQLDNVQKFYGGDFYSFAEDYFATVADLHQKTGCQIIAHFDLIKKFNGAGDLFDPNHPRYQAAMQKALSTLMDAPVILEVNTGGITRGYIKETYPSRDVISQWRKAGKLVMFASDCHDAQQLLAGYEIYELCL